MRRAGVIDSSFGVPTLLAFQLSHAQFQIGNQLVVYGGVPAEKALRYLHFDYDFRKLFVREGHFAAPFNLQSLAHT